MTKVLREVILDNWANVLIDKPQEVLETPQELDMAGISCAPIISRRYYFVVIPRPGQGRQCKCNPDVGGNGNVAAGVGEVAASANRQNVIVPATSDGDFPAEACWPRRPNFVLSSLRDARAVWTGRGLH